MPAVNGRRRSWRRWWALLLAAALLLVASAPPALSITSSTAFSAVAAADGAHYVFTTPNFLIVESVDGGGSSAQAVLDSLGTSRAFGSTVYPGDVALSAPGLVAGSLPAPPPGYPLIAQSSHPTAPSADAGTGPVSLHAESDERQSVGRSTVSPSSGGGIDVVGTTATARVGVDDGDVITAAAQNTARGISVDGALDIGSVSSRASVVVRPGQEPQVTSEIKISAFTAAGQDVAVKDGALVVGATGTPLPDSPVADVLVENGISLEYLAPRRSKEGGGALAPGLAVKLTRQVLPPPAGESTIELVLGRAFAHVSGEATTFAGSAADGASDTAQFPGVASRDPATTGAGLAGVSSDVTSAPDGGLAPSPSPPPGVAGSGTDERGEAALRLSALGASLPSWESLYLMLTLFAVALFGGMQVLRVLALKKGQG